MKKKLLLEDNINYMEESKLNKRIKLFKDIKWVSFVTYIMTGEYFCSCKVVVSYVPFINKVKYE